MTFRAYTSPGTGVDAHRSVTHAPNHWSSDEDGARTPVAPREGELMRRRVLGILTAAVAFVGALAGAAGSSGATGAVDLYVGDWAGGAIAHLDPSTGTIGPPISVGQGIIDVAISADGWMAYVTGVPFGLVPVMLETSTAGTAIPMSCATNIAIVPGREKAYVTQSCGTTVVPVDLATNTPGTPIQVGPSPWDVAIAPDGETAYVTTGDGALTTPDALVPIDVATDTAGTPIPLGTGGSAAGVAITPDGGTAFVAEELQGVVTPVDLVTRIVGAPIPVPAHPLGLVLTPDGSRLFVTHYSLFPSPSPSPSPGAEPPPADVTPIDVASRTALPQLVVGGQTLGAAVTPDGATVFVTFNGSASVPQRAVVPIDVATNSVGVAIPVSGEPTALAIRPPRVPDNTPPSVTLETTPAVPTGGGGAWFNQQDLALGTLTVTAHASDAGSGVASVSCDHDGTSGSAVGARLVVDGLGDGIHAFSCTARDRAGNVMTAPVTGTYQVDGTPPTLAPTVHGSGPGGAVLVGDPTPSASANAVDGGSGLLTASCGTPDVASVGSHTVGCTATDVAGNTRTTQASYVVEYRLVGLVPADGTVARSGQPLKLAVTLADASGAPATLCAGCSVQAEAFAVNGSGQDAGPFPMRYHNGSGEYRASWKPSPSGLGTTRITVSVLYPGTSVATTVSALVTIT